MVSQMHADKFVPFDDGIYLLNHSVGRPVKDSAECARRGFFAAWEELGEEVWPQWLQQIDAFRTALAGLLNGATEDFCPQTNLSGALTKLLYALPVSAGRDTVIMTEHDFPSMGFVLSRARQAGIKVRFIPATEDATDPATWARYLDSNCLAVLITHVHSNSSCQVPVQAIGELARQAGAYSIVDIAQSVGVVPIDLVTWQVDFVLGSSVKWLCGGPGAAFLWASKSVVGQCNPIDVGWFSHADPFEFDIHNFRYADGALKFWGGTPSVLPYIIAANSIETVDEIGIDTIRRHNLSLTQQLIDQLPHQYVASPRQPERRGGSLVLNFGKQQAGVEGRLRQAGILFDTRATGIRLSPHIYNTGAEMDTVLDCLDQNQL